MVFDGSGPSADVAKLSRDDAGQPSIPLTVGSHCTGWVWTVPGVNPQPISAVKSTTDKQRESNRDVTAVGAVALFWKKSPVSSVTSSLSAVPWVSAVSGGSVHSLRRRLEQFQW